MTETLLPKQIISTQIYQVKESSGLNPLEKVWLIFYVLAKSKTHKHIDNINIYQTNLLETDLS